MSAVLKEIVTFEPKGLIEILTVSDQLPADFYTNPAYDKQLDKAIEATNNLVYTLDDDGEKAAKADATNINKFSTLFDKYIAATFKQQTESVSAWRDGKKAKTKILLNNRQRLIDQFAAKRQEKLNDITDTVTKELLVRRIEKGIKEAFRNGADLSAIIKLTGTMTEGGQLTKKAKDFITSIVASDLAEQNRIEARHLTLEVRCLREDINPPLTHAHFGTVFYAADEFFNEKLEELIATEKQRRAEIEARIIRQQEAQKQKEIANALKAQQAESDRIAKEKAEAEKQKTVEEATVLVPIAPKTTDQPTPESLRESAKRIEQSASYADRKEDSRRELDLAKDLRKKADELEQSNGIKITAQHQDSKPVDIRPGKRTVKFTAEFEVVVSERVSDRGVEDHFMTKLPDDLKAILKKVSFHVA